MAATSIPRAFLLALALALTGCPSPTEEQSSGDTTATAPTTSAAPGPSAATGVATASDSAEAAWKKRHAEANARASATAAGSQAPAPRQPPTPAQNQGALTSEFHPSKPHLAIAGGDQLKIVDMNALAQPPLSIKAAGDIYGMSWASAAPRIAVGLNGRIQVFDTATGDVKHTFAALEPKSYARPLITLSHNGKHVAAAFDGSLYLWRTETGQAVALEEPADMSWGSAFMVGGKLLAAFTAGGVIVRRLSDGKIVHSRMFNTGATSPLQLSPGGSFLAVSEGQHGLLAYRIPKQEQTFLDRVDNCSDHLSHLRFSKNSKLLAVSSNGGYWRSWNLPTLSPRTTFKPDLAGPNWLSEDGGSGIVLADGAAVLFDAYKNKRRGTLDNFTGDDNAQLHFSADSRYVATRSGTIGVWDMNSGAKLF